MTRTDPMPHWLTGGFRPFFLLGALAMALPVLLWVPVMTGLVEIPTAFAPRDWHVHGLLLGAVPAIIAGFALTAVANWTGRPPVAGRRLLALVLLWLAGRVAVTFSAVVGPVVAAAVDVAFPLALAGVFAFEVVKGGSLRNLRVVALVGLLALVDAAFHAEALATGLAWYSGRAALAVVLVMILLVGGRIIPAFTRNWLAARRIERLPAPFGRVDGMAMIVSALALALWVAAPGSPATGVALAVAGLANIVRLSRWRGLATRSEPLLLVLHVGYAFVAAGFLATAAAAELLGLLAASTAQHVWTVGGVGTMTLAVMTRASRGHSGRPLASGPLEILIFALVALAAVARVAADLVPAAAFGLDAAALGFALAYLLFAAGYARMLLLPPRPAPAAAGASTGRA